MQISGIVTQDTRRVWMSGPVLDLPILSMYFPLSLIVGLFPCNGTPPLRVQQKPLFPHVTSA